MAQQQGTMAQQQGAMGQQGMTSGNIRWVSNPRVQPLPASNVDTTAGNLPVCSATRRDHCINRSEARGQTARARTR